MKTIATLAIFWCLSIIGGFFIGRQILFSRRQATEQQRLEQDCPGIRGIIQSRAWPEHYQESERWRDIENRFSVDIDTSPNRPTAIDQAATR